MQIHMASLPRGLPQHTALCLPHSARLPPPLSEGFSVIKGHLVGKVSSLGEEEEVRSQRRPSTACGRQQPGLPGLGVQRPLRARNPEIQIKHPACAGHGLLAILSFHSNSVSENECLLADKGIGSKGLCTCLLTNS